MINLILLAAPGAGKGTLSKRLQEKYGYAHISTGDLLREKALKGDELGNKIKAMQEAGQLVTSEIVYAALEDKLKSPECSNGYILDGFPRNLEQAFEYEKILGRLNKNIGTVISIEVPRDVLVERITGRRSCKECGIIYNIYNPAMTPKVEGICDKCSGELMHRSDDTLETLDARYDTYLKNTEPLISYYSEKGILHKLNGIESMVTYNQCIELLDKLGE